MKFEDASNFGAVIGVVKHGVSDLELDDQQIPVVALAEIASAESTFVRHIEAPYSQHSKLFGVSDDPTWDIGLNLNWYALAKEYMFKER